MRNTAIVGIATENRHQTALPQLDKYIQANQGISAMPEIVSSNDIPARKREGAGRSRVYVVDLSPLAGIAGAVDEATGKPMAAKYTPRDLLAPNGEVAQLSTFLAQAREWVKEFNESPESGGVEYRIKAQNQKILDENENHIRGTVDPDTGEPIPSEEEDATKLYNSFVMVVPMTAKDRKNREARATAKRKQPKNNESEETQGDTEVETEEIAAETASSGRRNRR